MRLFVFMLAGFIGFEVIRRVSPLLHTPLMSLTNALDAIAVVGAIMLVGRAREQFVDGAGDDRDGCGDQQHRGRISDHRPHAEDVQSRARPKKVDASIPQTLTVSQQQFIEVDLPDR